MAGDHAMKQYGDFPTLLTFSTLGEEISQKVSHKVLYVMAQFQFQFIVKPLGRKVSHKVLYLYH